MDLEIRWSKEKRLIAGTDKGITYKLEDPSHISRKPGVYIFARKYKGRMIPIYIGKAIDLRHRVNHHLKRDKKLMKAIKEERPLVNRYLVTGELIPKPGVDAAKAIHIIEQSLIEHSLANGFDILNISGTKRPVHTIKFKRNLFARSLTGPLMKVKQQG